MGGVSGAEHFARIDHDPEYRERWFSALAKTIAVDFDGVLHPYTDGWVGPVPADEPPTEGAETFLATLVGDGFRIVVFSTRCDTEEGLAGTCAWLDKHKLTPMIHDVTCQKPAAVAYVDDRAVTFRGDWASVLNEIDVLADGRPHGAAAVIGPPAGVERVPILRLCGACDEPAENHRQGVRPEGCPGWTEEGAHFGPWGSLEKEKRASA